MEKFKYYKRGKGELDTSNFDLLFKQGSVEVDLLDDRTFVALFSLQNYIYFPSKMGDVKTQKLFTVYVKGYVAHMRGDKDLYCVADNYSLLPYMKFVCSQIQHESNEAIMSAKVGYSDILNRLNLSRHNIGFVGADKSVPKFFSDPIVCADKVREGGKVVSMDFNVDIILHYGALIIVDDILGGGATIQMLYDMIRAKGYAKDIYLWVQYNEAIHSEEFLDQFKNYYIGDLI